MSTDKPSMRDRLRYRLDNFLARGSSALFLALVVAFIISVVGISILRAITQYISPDLQNDISRQVWLVFLQLTDPGNMNQDNDTPMPFKFAAIVAGLTGVVIFSALIAFLTTALDQTIAHLKRGHTRVLEKGHTLILGWNSRIVEILEELEEAKESEADPVVVILSEESKEEMDEYLRGRLPRDTRLRVVTRSGPTAALDSLERVSTQHASSAIVLAKGTGSATLRERSNSDAHAIKTVLALETQTTGTGPLNIVAEVFLPRNRQVLEEMVGEGGQGADGGASVNVVAIDVDNILAKIMVQTSRTSGLSVVYSELLSFMGCEIYFFQTDWQGMRFGEALFGLGDGVPMGIQRVDGSLEIRPDPATVLQSDDHLIVVAEDDSTIELRSVGDLPTAPAVGLPDRRKAQRQEHLLIVGWSNKASIIIQEFADYVLASSTVDILLADPPEEVRTTIARLADTLSSLNIMLVEKDPLAAEELEILHPIHYDNIIVLPQRPGEDVPAEAVDAETLIVLLHLRRIMRGKPRETTPKIITEVLDSANHQLVHQAGVDDFIISDRMVSMIFAQLSEQPAIRHVYDDLFQEDGSEIYVKDASLYFPDLPVRCTFSQLIAQAQQRDREICIGYKLGGLASDAGANYGVKLIPAKATMVTLSLGDSLIVVAEDER